MSIRPHKPIAASASSGAVEARAQVPAVPAAASEAAVGGTLRRGRSLSELTELVDNLGGMVLRDLVNRDAVGTPSQDQELVALSSIDKIKETVSIGIGASSVVIRASPLIASPLTEDLALKVFFNGDLSEYHQRQNHEAQIRARISPEMRALGFSDSPITLLGNKTFTIYNRETNSFSSLEGECRVERMLLEDGMDIKVSSPKELYSMFACLIHQVDILHRNNIIHADIKPENFCKTPEGLFELIDMDKSLITDDPKIYERPELDFAVSPNFIEREEYLSLKRARTPEEAMDKGKSLDILSLGSTMYQMIYAFKAKKSLIGCSLNSFPHTYDSEGMIKSLKSKRELQGNLRGLEPDRIDIIIRMLSLNPLDRPSIEELKAAFPSTLIRG